MGATTLSSPPAAETTPPADPEATLLDEHRRLVSVAQSARAANLRWMSPPHDYRLGNVRGEVRKAIAAKCDSLLAAPLREVAGLQREVKTLQWVLSLLDGKHTVEACDAAEKALAEFEAEHRLFVSEHARPKAAAASVAVSKLKAETFRTPEGDANVAEVEAGAYLPVETVERLKRLGFTAGEKVPPPEWHEPLDETETVDHLLDEFEDPAGFVRSEVVACLRSRGWHAPAADFVPAPELVEEEEDPNLVPLAGLKKSKAKKAGAKKGGKR
jgi:hypothetical protein